MSRRVSVEQRWGSARNFDEMHGQAKVYGCADTLEAAAHGARVAALEADIEARYLAQALSEAVYRADREAEQDTDPFAGFDTAAIVAELARRQAH